MSLKSVKNDIFLSPRKERERERVSLITYDAFLRLSHIYMGGHQHNDSKVSLTPPHLLDVIDEQWLEDSLPFDDVDVPLAMRLSSSQFYDAYDDVGTSSSISGGGNNGATMHHPPGVGVAFSAGGGGGTGGGGAQGAGAGFNPDGDEDRNEERWGRGRY